MIKKHHKTTVSDQPIAQPLTTPATPSAATNQPEFLRLPPAGGVCPWTGLRRSKLNELILPVNGQPPLVKSIRLTNKGQKKAVRLVVFKSLMDYLHGLEGK